MAVRIVSLTDVPRQQLPGRELQWLVTPETIGAEKISMAVMDCPAGSTVRPLHAHRDIEEILYILEGEGEAWVDGEVGKFKAGDAVLFPANSKHMVRNTGTTPLRTCSIFSPPTSPDTYVLFEDEGWQNDAGVAGIANRARDLGTSEDEIKEAVRVVYLYGGTPALVSALNAFPKEHL